MILYKYYPDSLYTYRSLAFKGLWCHHAQNMNDPFECLGYIDREITSEQCEIFRMAFSDSKNLHRFTNMPNEKVKEFINLKRKETIKRYAFCSLSEEFDSIIMWSHYASSHTGIVIGFEFKDEEIDYHFQKIEYVDDLPVFDVLKLAEFMKGEYEYLPHFISDISIKSKPWSSEKEWRIWRSIPCYYHYKIENVRSIYFGVNCSLETKKIVLDLLSELPHDFQINEMRLGANPIRLEYN